MRQRPSLATTPGLRDLDRQRVGEVSPGTARLLTALFQAIEALPAEEVPALLAALSACVGQLAVRLLSTTSPASAAEPDENLSVEEAARRLGVSADYLYRNHSRLPFTRRIGRRLLFSSRGLERWNANRR